MSAAITGEQRNALYGQTVLLLSGIDNLWRVVQEEDFERADQLAREVNDALTFVLTDLGWGEQDRDVGPIELKTDPEIVRRVLSRFRDKAMAWHGEEEREVAKAQAAESESRGAVEAIGEVLQRLEGRA
jgi:hypothetical protein